MQRWDPKFVDNYDTFILDCDGVLWLEKVLLPGIKDVLTRLRSNGKRVLFLTNNSSKSRVQYAKIFKKLGIPTAPETLFPSSFAAADYMAKRIPKSKKIFVIGGSGLIDEVELQGFRTVTGHDIPIVDTPKEMAAVPLDKEVGAVVVGMDSTFNYCKFSYAIRCILEQNAQLFFANPDRLYPAAPGVRLPGNGSQMGFFKEALTLTEPTICGKPNGGLFDSMQSIFGTMPKERCLMVGDNLETDILFGHNANIDSLLVLTGISKEDMAKKANKPPTFVIDSLADIYGRKHAKL